MIEIRDKILVIQKLSCTRKARKLENIEIETKFVYNETESSEKKTKNSSKDSVEEKLKNKKKCNHHDENFGEFKNIKPTIFNGEVETREEVEV
jgi:hypothetical protein